MPRNCCNLSWKEQSTWVSAQGPTDAGTQSGIMKRYLGACLVMIGPVADAADLVMGCEERNWLCGGQNVGPTKKIICRKFVHIV